MFILCTLISCEEADKTAENPIKTEITAKFDKLHNGDAKIFGSNIITSIDGKLTVLDMNGKLVKTFEDISASWIDGLAGEGIIVYGNSNNEIGIVRLDDSFNILENKTLIQSQNLLIDPAITKVDENYYITATEISGNVNNSDPTLQNGRYTIHFYRLENLDSASYIGDVISADNNLEDIDLFYKNNKFYVTYEKEELDKGNSSINVIESTDFSALQWGQPIVLLDATSDHEPAAIEQTDNGYILYYSCDMDNPGTSYSGAKAYYAQYDDNFNLISKDNLIHTQTSEGILLYDVKNTGSKKLFLYAKNYLSDCDLILEESDT